jgi:hypothetical protein
VAVTVSPAGGKDLEVSKTATPSFTRTYAWDISKDVDNTLITIASGGTATFNYKVDVTHDSGTDSDWQVSGTIKVNNPNTFDVTATVTDASAGGTCSVTDGFGITIPAGKSADFSYSCTFTSNPGSGTNTATASWDKATYYTPHDSVTGTADFTFGDPTKIVHGSVTVTDSVDGGTATTLGTVSYTDPTKTTFTYSHGFGGVAGTCTDYTNTATIKETEQTASKTVTVCVGEDLTVEKTATPSSTWSITKTCSNNPTGPFGATCFGGSTFYYKVVVTNTENSVSGTITVKNPNDWEAITATLSDSVDNGGTCSVSAENGFTSNGDGTVTGSIAASTTLVFDYSCTYSSAPSPSSGTNTAEATWDATAYFTPDDSASGKATFEFGSVTVTDTLGGSLGSCDVTTGTCTWTYSHTFTLPSDSCATFTNTAKIVETEQTSTATAYACPPDFATSSSFCAITDKTANLILVQDGSTTFNLRASNPGQFYQNIFYTAAPGSGFTITINVPYPFVTQGAHPIQTSSSFALNTNGLCISPLFDNAVTGIAAAGNHVSSSRYPVVLLDDSGSTPTITVTGTVPASGLVYITVHLDYGLKGYDFNKGPPRTFNGFNSYDALLSTNTALVINNGQSYAFSTAEDLISSFTLNSINTFKKDPGFAGVVLDSTGNPVAGVTVQIYDPKGKLLATVITDEDGFYSYQYKYTGSPATFTIKLPAYNLSQSVKVQSNKLVEVDFQLS